MKGSDLGGPLRNRRRARNRPFPSAPFRLVALLLLGLAACAAPDTIPVGVATSPREAASFVSNGRPVRVETIRASRGGPRPAVILLHGASGIGSGWLIYPYADAITRRGIHAFVIHYFDGLSSRTGNRSGTGHFQERERIIRDAISHIAGLPSVNGRRIGLFGLSLGGFHAVALGASDPRIAAIVDLMGAMPRSVPAHTVQRMPPTLILHGTRDPVVPVQRAVNLALLLGRVGAPFEMKLYVGGGHDMRGAAHGNSIELTAEFFDRYLNRRSGRTE